MTKRAVAQRLLDLSAQIEVELQATTGGAPLAHHLNRSRKRCIDALWEMAEVDATDATKIRNLQMAVQMHALLLDDLREIVTKGSEAADYLDHEARDEIADAIGLTQGEEATTPNEDQYAD